MQEIPPESVVFLTQPENVDKVQASFRTVIEDAGPKDVRLSVVPQKTIQLSDILVGLENSFFNLLVERDFLLPDFSQRSGQFFQQKKGSNLARHTFWQRTINGGSNSVKSHKDLNQHIVPASTLVFKRTSGEEYSWLDNFNDAYEYSSGHVIADWIEGNNCVIQSNRPSAFAPKALR
jgi:hypothetical protein